MELKRGSPGEPGRTRQTGGMLKGAIGAIGDAGVIGGRLNGGMGDNGVKGAIGGNGTEVVLPAPESDPPPQAFSSPPAKDPTATSASALRFLSNVLHRPSRFLSIPSTPASGPQRYRGRRQGIRRKRERRDRHPERCEAGGREERRRQSVRRQIRRYVECRGNKRCGRQRNR